MCFDKIYNKYEIQSMMPIYVYAIMAIPKPTPFVKIKVMYVHEIQFYTYDENYPALRCK
jgi:hypothetical protein